MPTLRPSIENLRSLGNWSQSFRWNVSFINFPNYLSYIPTNDDINFRAESISIPELQVETTEIQIRGNKVRQSGLGTYNSPITLTLIETINPVCLKFLSAWQEICWHTKDGSIGTTEYKKDLQCDMQLLLLDNLDNPYYRYELIGCFLEGATKGDVDASNGDPLKPQLSIAYDYFKSSAI